MQEFEILKWAVGAIPELPALDSVDEKKLYRLLVRHRLGPRFLQCLKGVCPSWCSERLLARLREQRARASVHLDLRVRALRELQEALGPNHPPLVVVKGFSTYALTGDRRHLRPSGDVDLLCPDAEHLYQTMRALGYVGERQQENHHEYAGLRRPNVTFEIHRFFPVYSYPKEVMASNLLPSQNLRYWTQNFEPPPRQKISYADLGEYSQCGVTPETCDISVPEPEMAVLLLCAHEFREFCQLPLQFPIPVRLALLADIYDLTQRDNFDTAHFCALVERFDGTASVRLIGHFLQTVFGVNPLPFDASLFVTNERLPRQIAFRGGWASLGTAHEWLLGLDSATILQRLGTNRIVVGANQEAISYTVEKDVGESIQHAIIHTLNGEPLALRFSIARNEKSLLFKVVLPALHEENTQYRIRLDGTGESELGHAVNIGAPGEWEQNGDGQATLDIEDDEYQLQISLPTPLESPLFLLTAMRRDRRIADFYDAECVIAVPIEIMQPEVVNET